MNNQVAIKAVYTITERQWLMVHLLSHEWDWKGFGPVYLSFPGKKIEMTYTASGNIGGEPVVVLTPSSTTGLSLKAIKEMIDEAIDSSEVLLEKSA